MYESIEKKLDKIADIWNNYIWEYKFCNSRIKFTTDVKSNYFGDILCYFSDTWCLIYGPQKTETFSGEIASSIVLLQTIYVQQDFIEELLNIFRCNIDKGDLKKDSNYTINRELRNELVGHPIRKEDINGKRQLRSSTIFSNSTNEFQISYVRYHIKENYKFEHIIYTKKDILQRHSDFLNFYFDIIIQKLKKILHLFKKRIEEIERVIKKGTFDNILNIVSNTYEYIFKIDYLYKPDTLIEAYKLRNSNRRYQNAVELFINELKQSLSETKKDICELINDKDRHSMINNLNKTDKKIHKINLGESKEKADISKIPVSYHYEMGKLVSKEDINKFQFFSSLLKSKCMDNEIVLDEIANMEKNLDNDLEYYCSYHLIDKVLNGE